MVVTAICALLLLPVMLHLRTLRRESEAIRQLSTAGADVWYAEDLASASRLRWTLAWVTPALGLQSYPPQMVSFVEYSGDRENLELLKDLDTVTDVAFVHANVDTDLMEVFLGMSALTTLNLSDTDVDDDCLRLIEEKQELQYINVMGSKVSPQGVERFHQKRPDCRLSVAPDTRFMKWLNRLFETSQSSIDQSMFIGP